ncbi:cyanophycin synthetase [Caulobacter segnis]|uniref:cyanophycin synthetase n=1 Tax=Caulobacter segnis TaxID=88688 RepID=UPI00241028BD|nr:cyanophycin synthetase [Caulobacter segnis]MDG2520360.1 cyanophycin synthetase [Caulobacter segnis]
MRVIERAVYRGPHLYSSRPMIRIMLDLEALEDMPTNRLDGFTDRLLAILPGLEAHGCSLRRPGGMVERMRDGTWLGHVIEHVALELQTLAGAAATRGKTRSVAGRRGVYNIMYVYEDEHSGLAAGRMAIELVCGLLPRALGRVEGLDLIAPPLAPASGDGPLPGLAALSRLRVRHGLGPSTRALVDAARRRGIPFRRLDEHSLIAFGQGCRQQRLRASITGRTSHVAVETAGNKDLTKRLLAQAGLPTPRGEVVRSVEAAIDAAARLPGPVVVKPLDGNHGRGVSIGLIGPEAVAAAFAMAREHSPRIIVEQQLVGRDHRALVVGGRLVAVAERRPARVVGDGEADLATLIERLNADPRRGDGHEKIMTKVRIDDALAALLQREGYGLDYRPAPGQTVVLRETANLSTGGEAIDRTAEVHPDNVATIERAARVIGLDVAGLDILIPDISRPFSEVGGGIIEINAAPGLRMHLQPSDGQARDVAGPIIEQLYPRGSRSRIPVIAVTGTNGKSTTVRMIDHILRGCGWTVGMTTTSGVYIDGRLIRKGDASGPRSARMVLDDPTVEAAVLETARGGILREGLAFDRADVGVVLNVAEDHLGLKGVETIEDLAKVKSVVVDQVSRRGVSVLNADDPYTLRMARHAKGRVGFFSLRGGAEMPALLQKHLAQGGLAAVLEPSVYGGLLVIHDGSTRIEIARAADMPASLGGAARFNLQNALAACLAAYVQGVPVDKIAAGLASFESSFEQNPGRLNLTRAPGFTTIVDYAHNPAALQALGGLLAKMRADHDRVIGVVSIPGDRRDEDIRAMGQLAAELFDEVIFRERPDGRGRAPGGVLSLLSDAAIATGMAPERVRRILDEPAAVDTALRLARAGDLVVLLPTEVEQVWRQTLAFRMAGGSEDGLEARIHA